MREILENSMCHDITSDSFDAELKEYQLEQHRLEKKLKIYIFIAIALIIVWIFMVFYGLIKYLKQENNQDEYIKILEQSLQEQLQEKQVYMKMLEEKQLIEYLI